MWNYAVFSKSRDRLLTTKVGQQFFIGVNEQAKCLMSDGHPTINGTLIQAWTLKKSFRKKNDSNNDGASFYGQKFSNDTHESAVNLDFYLRKKSYGKELHSAYLGHALIENRNGLVAAAMACSKPINTPCTRPRCWCFKKDTR